MANPCLWIIRSALTLIVILPSNECFSTWKKSFAASPVVVFDVGTLVECHDVTPWAFTQVNPDEKVIEAVFSISILFEEGQSQDTSEIILNIISPEKRLQVIDFQPRTRATSEIAGPIEVARTKETENSYILSMGADIPGIPGLVATQVSPSAGTGRTERNISQETFRRLAPQELVLASGTTHYSHGVFFKLKPSNFEAFEGMKVFTCRYRVPAAWRADWAVVSCHGYTKSNLLFQNGRRECGHMKRPVGLYLAGDTSAKQTVSDLVQPRSSDKPWPSTSASRSVFKPIVRQVQPRLVAIHEFFPWDAFWKRNKPSTKTSFHDPEANDRNDSKQGGHTAKSLAESLELVEKLSGFRS